MDFTVDSLHTMEKDLDSAFLQILRAAKVHTIDELTRATLVKHLNKDPLADFVQSLAVLLKSNLQLCKAAAGKIDELKSDQIASLRKLTETQQEQSAKVQDNVKSELKSWSDAVKQNCSKSITSTKVKDVVKLAVAEDDRSKSFIVYGEKEESDEDLVDVVTDIINKVGEKLHVVERFRVGVLKANVIRPIKVKLASAEAVNRVLKNASKLKETNLYRSTYLAPDRTWEERTSHNKLVVELKEKIKEQPTRHHYIRNKKVLTTDKLSSSSERT